MRLPAATVAALSRTATIQHGILVNPANLLEFDFVSALQNLEEANAKHTGGPGRSLHILKTTTRRTQLDGPPILFDRTQRDLDGGTVFEADLHMT